MDEYSPRNYDIAVLKYLCDELCREGTQTLIRSNNYWVNDLASDSNLKLNELLGYIADVEIGRASCRERVCLYV